MTTPFGAVLRGSAERMSVRLGSAALGTELVYPVSVSQSIIHSIPRHKLS